MTSGKMINIGCGSIHHPDWINLDIASDDPSVKLADITRGLPFASSSISVCYSSHVLEHMERTRAYALLEECYRVLEPGGILRLAVPDLESIAREYLSQLERLLQGDTSRFQDYEWIMLEMYDQVVRNKPGGEMARFLARLSPSVKSYVVSRIGNEALRIWDTSGATTNSAPHAKYYRIWQKRFRRYRLRVASLLVRLVAGQAAAASFERGVFRDNGEVHLWMYDSYSLARLLEEAGFIAVQKCGAHESRIIGFEAYNLDTENGRVRKPDSLFIEAMKP